MAKKQKFHTPELSVEELSKALYEVNLQLQATNQKILEDERRRREFYANISHDLRAPVTAISNSLQYLLSAGSDEITQESVIETLEIMQKRTAFLERLINDIFLLASLDSSASKVHKESVDLRFLLEDYFYMCEADDRFSHCKLKFEIPDDFEAKAMLDPMLMRRVFDNLYNNALKYSSENPEITLSASLNHDKKLATISLADNGIGIDEDSLPHIFDRSFQTSKARTPDAYSGSGFGLAIVRSIIERHNGSINCQSLLGKGSIFTINIPII